jgi:hypothetical protein
MKHWTPTQNHNKQHTNIYALKPPFFHFFWDIPYKQVLMTLMRNIAVKSGVYHCHAWWTEGNQENNWTWAFDQESIIHQLSAMPPVPRHAKWGAKDSCNIKHPHRKLAHSERFCVFSKQTEKSLKTSEDCRMAAWLCAFTGSNVEQVPKIIKWQSH